MDVYEVFKPTGVPTTTYVDRGDLNLEKQLIGAIKTPGMIVSLSGPSKSGKTVLVKKVVDPDLLITIYGAGIKSAEMLWDRVLNWMESPAQISKTTGHSTGAELNAEGSAKIGKWVAEAEGRAGAKATYDYERTTEITSERNGIDQVVKEIAESDFVLFIDDFHYMPRDIQQDIGRHIKEAAERGVSICTASVPHRADDVVRGNTELRGRVHGIDFAYWSTEQLKAIAYQGFSQLNVELDEDSVCKIAAESFGSPQLMQQICLQACLKLDVHDTYCRPQAITLTGSDLPNILEQASTTTDFSSLLEALHNGPKQRGTTRTQFNFTDGSSGDVYRCILLAIASDPPRLSFPYDDIYSRTREVCVDDAPAGSSVASALEQLPGLAANIETNPVLEWDEDVLDIVDPYFLYYLRCSSRMRYLQRP
ncbi:hypothetical protein [Erythrobacter sp. A6_0]|uniref:hypothetical protein n=1 Tax=Erythrobacter sp. A6_0 TaxID=2821089 RepID=UPI001ADD3267|nr:hypothetical protein [Erythrobacter sp. A6_0]MBO9511674.1 hypothetical protein [Erythrobacter sp. A6_0]